MLACVFVSASGQAHAFKHVNLDGIPAQTQAKAPVSNLCGHAQRQPGENVRSSDEASARACVNGTGWCAGTLTVETKSTLWARASGASTAAGALAFLLPAGRTRAQGWWGGEGENRQRVSHECGTRSCPSRITMPSIQDSGRSLPCSFTANEIFWRTFAGICRFHSTLPGHEPGPHEITPAQWQRPKSTKVEGTHPSARPSTMAT